MLGGSLVVGLCLLLLGWTAEVVGIFVSDPAKVRGNAALSFSRGRDG
jgi:solute carrier family 45 protein 1/2/4